MADIDKFKKHINEPVKVKLEASDGTEDEFKFQPLTASQFAKLMIIGDRINKNQKVAQFRNKQKGNKKLEEPTMNPEDAKEMMDLYVDIVKHSYPDISDEVASQFVVANFQDLGDIIEKLSPQNVDKKKIETIKNLKNPKDAKRSDS